MCGARQPSALDTVSGSGIGATADDAVMGLVMKDLNGFMEKFGLSAEASEELKGIFNSSVNKIKTAVEVLSPHPESHYLCRARALPASLKTLVFVGRSSVCFRRPGRGTDGIRFTR